MYVYLGIIFLSEEYGLVFFQNDPPLNEFADFERYSVGQPYELTHTIWSKSDQKYDHKGQMSYFSEIWLSFYNLTSTE